jgi:drug/metabolite transporter (DMT)-like permease
MKLKDGFAFTMLCLVWGSSFFWIKIALQEIGPFTLVAFRLLFGVLGLSIYAGIRRPRWPHEIQVWRNLFILGIINTALPFVLISWGEQTIDSGIASILNSTVPLFTALFAHLLLKDDTLSSTRIVGILIGFIGVLCVILQKTVNQGTASWIGYAAVLLATISYSIAAVYARTIGKNVAPIVQSLGTLLMADSILWIAVFINETPLDLPSLPLTWAALLWLGVLGSFLAYLLYYSLIQSIGPTKASMVGFTFPVVGVILGTLFLNEILNWQTGVGGAMVAASIFIVNRNGSS